jgi:hypothetical protein
MGVLRGTLAVCALTVVVGLLPGAVSARASGPGLNLVSRANSQTIRLSGSRIAAAADTGPAPYTLRSRPGSSGTKLTLRGLSIAGLLRLAGIDPFSVDFISVVRQDGSLATLTRADIVNPTFPEGPALVTDEPAGTRFFRPVRGPSGTNVRDNVVASSGGGPLDVTVGGGSLLAVRASASPRRTSVGRTVTFGASVRFPPPGATFSYQWDFGDGTTGYGQRVTHQYTQDGDLLAQVSVDGSGSTSASCANTCGGVAQVQVRVGKSKTSPRPATSPGSAGANPNAPGAGGGGSGGGGSGGSGGGSGNATAQRPSKSPAKRAPQAAKKQPPRKPPPRVEAGDTITGILLADSRLELPRSLPELEAAGGTPGLRRSAEAGPRGGGELGGSIALTILLIVLGALHERRQGRLRVA